jgi:hypothetical protein
MFDVSEVRFGFFEVVYVYSKCRFIVIYCQDRNRVQAHRAGGLMHPDRQTSASAEDIGYGEWRSRHGYYVLPTEPRVLKAMAQSPQPRTADEVWFA